MPDISASSWNESDPLNNATPPTGWPEGQMPSTVNDCARMMMGGLKRWWNRANPTISASGTSGAYAYATANTLFPTAYQQGETYSFKAPFTSVGGDTFVVNALTALPIYSRTGSGTLGAIAAGDIQSGTYITLAYDSALNAGAGGFQLLGGSNSAPINNPSFGGTVTVTNLQITTAATGVTVPTGDNSTNLATTAYVKNQGYATTGYVNGTFLPLAGGTSGGVTLSGGNISGGGSASFSGNVIGNNAVESNGVYFQNNSNYFYTPNSFMSGGSVCVSGNTGMYWQNNGGWMYTPVGMRSASINTGDIQMNGGALSGCSNIASANEGSIGGVAMPGGGTVDCGQVNAGNISCGALNTNGNSIDSGSVNSHGADVVTGHCYPVDNGGHYCGVGSNSWAAVYSYAYPGPSGRELKTDIANASGGALEQVLALRTVKFRWKDGPDDKLHHGFIADEAAEVLGQDFGGYQKSEGAETLDKTEMVCVLWQAVQELTARLEALEAR